MMKKAKEENSLQIVYGLIWVEYNLKNLILLSNVGKG